MNEMKEMSRAERSHSMAKRCARLLIFAGVIGLDLWPLYQAHAQVCHIGARRRCDVQSNYGTGWLKTSYTIVSVDYVPPGVGSYVEYGVGGQVGTTVSTTDSWQASLEVARDFDLSFYGVSLATVNLNFNNAWGGSTATSIDENASYASTTRINGPGGDNLNHDYDQIFLALDPIVLGESWDECVGEQWCDDTLPPSWTDCYCTGPNVPKLRWSIDARNSLPQIVRVGWLTGTVPMPDNVRGTLEAHGITPADYPQMLAADPFASDPTGVSQPDPARFVPVAAYPYEYVSDTFTYQTNNNYNHSVTTGSSTSHTVKVSASGGVLGSKLKVSGDFTWKNESQQRVSSGTSATETFFLTMPSADYTGPTIMYLYIDKIYKTFMVSPIAP